MNKEEIIYAVSEFVKERLEKEGSGHDWWHINRVRTTALQLAEEYRTDAFIIELASLVHDLPDRKMKEELRMTMEEVEGLLSSFSVQKEEAEEIIRIIDTISFKGTGKSIPDSIEGKIVQDADRLDAIGAIGIARTFAYAGSKGHLIYHPLPDQGSATAIQHFYDKLLKIRGLMNTEAAKREADERHRFMELYLQTFFREWSGKS
ncbi:HD domain-containing protein [Bacillus sp. FJAT-42376]|uniref:HD domain-containing protein n=1 Tax=Bacillus sp. FJAT-42376 TaxID=2014076 RepID=UPI000F4DC70B|nr:HD domain-containing protein [Bacillus sp. FJAT-42376]AZB44871.1 HD domain-containing protein [Bacillus sp. FJAT-42376]